MTSLHSPLYGYYFDSSALVKRYAAERGSAWVQALCDDRFHAPVIAHIGLVEIAAALSSKRRGGFLSAAQYDRLLAELVQDARSRYALVRVSAPVIDQAMQLTRRHRLRGYDAVHLACALAVNRILRDQDLPPLIFIAADHDLLIAAQAEGLAVDNPNDHP